ncbi:LysR family transcriptional regulator [Actinocorallia sp. A-T 12471]|uniref:LysR family transcriptional regulator n=1 Tax=Actinocorallia sp. A-T 12471 TaxID=3089813 RepID=UPI0029CC9AF8|nr:LysR family transcriptional regulator [Actinocorallia sp. A-T 12471]MDX6744110.1 LysR family transcriptional regulator [Actinocorallia sp. A-T 12471]
MNLASLDLNLLVALHALLEERNVTRAGHRIGLSQPATSAALGRLRRHFNDELLVRQGNAYELTPLGAALRERSAGAYRMLDQLFTARMEFDPATEEREFALYASDYAVAVFGADLSRELSEVAPGVQVRFMNIAAGLVEQPEAILTGADGVLMPHGIISGVNALDLYDDAWVCLVSADHPEIGDALTLADLARLPWVSYQRLYDAPVARQIAMLGLEPHVEASAASFVLLPDLVVGTRRVTLIQRRLADRLADRSRFRVLPCPFEAVPVKEALWWHPIHAQDAAHAWLRETAVRVASRLPALPEPA